MDDRTRNYLHGRFRDYYRQATITPPPAANEREWGHIPWTAGNGTTMIRHQSQLDLGDLSDFFTRTAPRHAYFSAGRYRDPGASTMGNKGWNEADLVFDLDADHLPGVDPDETTYKEMLAECKNILHRLLSFLEDDFAFNDMEIVFSGGRGYHVHVRDESVRSLGSDGRTEIVDYVRGVALDTESLIQTVSKAGTTQRMLRNHGGWGKRIHAELLTLTTELQSMSEADAIERLESVDGIGAGRAKTIYGAVVRNPDAIAAGNMEAGGPGIRILVDAIVEQVITEQTAPIDEPVTTDTHRLIRLPGTLHGGSGLEVKRIEREELESFDPLRDAVPRRFIGQEIAVNCEQPLTVELNGDTTKLPEGVSIVPEYVGLFLMCRGDATKARE